MTTPGGPATRPIPVVTPDAADAKPDTKADAKPAVKPAAKPEAAQEESAPAAPASAWSLGVDLFGRHAGPAGR